jgi:hypothetical protein
MMTTQSGAGPLCATCGKAASTLCAGCTDTASPRPPTAYCSKNCQKADWDSHKTHCQSIQSQKKLFRAGDLLRDAYLATRVETFDLSLSKVELAEDGKIHVFSNITGIVKPGPFPSALAATDEIMQAVLSYAHGDSAIINSIVKHLIPQALKGESRLQALF